mmetsp:Transcript_16640/g.24881  ORF Transcript_16640/g.24881 Transcript_16640/m.24881 type:complete len:89 (+) Transcript_16640:934-1200(+)
MSGKITTSGKNMTNKNPTTKLKPVFLTDNGVDTAVPPVVPVAVEGDLRNDAERIILMLIIMQLPKSATEVNILLFLMVSSTTRKDDQD